MKIGTKSMLFGVHAFWWHPICVARAWRLLMQRWPQGLEWLAILFHDVGYFGKSDIDGKSGITHPELGAAVVEFFARRSFRKTCRWRGLDLVTEQSVDTVGEAWWDFTAGHSASYAKVRDIYVSPLYYADKVAALMEPVWFYLLRAWLSGEGKEFERRSPVKGKGLRCWFRWYWDKLATEHLGKQRLNTLRKEPRKVSRHGV